MATEKKQRGTVPDPAETSRDSQQHQKEVREGDFRNAEKDKQKAAYFDDDYETRKENEIGREEAKTENENGGGE